MNRRRFASASAAFAALSVLPRTATAAKKPRLAFPRAPHDRIAVSSYPFRFQMVAPSNNRRDPKLPGMTVLQFADFVVKEFGLHAIEVLDKHFEQTDEDSLRTLRKELQARRVTLVNIPFDNKAQLCNDNADDHAAAMALHRRWIDNAVLLGCPSVRMRMPVGADPKVLKMACAEDALRILTAYAESRNVMLNLENDSPFTESSPQLMAVAAQVGSPWLRVLPDMANGLAAGDAAYNLREMQALFPLAYNIAHAKSWETISGVRQDINLADVVKVAESSGYRGWYSLESDSRDDARADTHRLLASMLKCLSA